MVHFALINDIFFVLYSQNYRSFRGKRAVFLLKKFGVMAVFIGVVHYLFIMGKIITPHASF